MKTLKICIIKLGALGDVVRTTQILEAIKERFPASEIIWVTKKESQEIFKGNPKINKLVMLPYELNEGFDVLYNFDIDKEATTLALEIKAKEKFGFYNEAGYPAVFNPGAEYYLNTIFDDELKKTNKKTYQQMIFDCAELKWKKQKMEIYLSEKNKSYAEEFLKNNMIKKGKLIGIHIGSSSRWPSKAWAEDKIEEFIEKASVKGYQVIIFGGQNETEKMNRLTRRLNKKGIGIFKNNPENTIGEFASLVNLCNIMISGDTLALHISLALGKPTIGLFFCTSPDEIEGYNLLKKIVSPILYDFFPERMNEYSKELVNSISAEEVLKRI